MDKVRVGVIGIGNMGSSHASELSQGEIPGGELAAIADIDSSKRDTISERYGNDVAIFATADEMLAADCVDAIIIATPHYDHPPIAIAAFEKGVHVLSEKPSGVYTKQVREMNAAADASGKIFGVMFNQRTAPAHVKMKEFLGSGELGEIKRNAWIITSWYRPQSYYNSGGWRASWAGEGGGVLLNQCPHQLDLWQWFCGMPKRVRAFCQFGQYHDIEVEDNVTAYVEYENGATGTFITSTGEAPGTNTFEVAGSMGRITMEGGKLSFIRNTQDEREFNRNFQGGFGAPDTWNCEIPTNPPPAKPHSIVMKRWVEAILQDDSSCLIADGREGINGLAISNAMLLSAWTDDWVDLPLNDDQYYELLQERIKTSTYEKPETQNVTLSVDGTF